MGREIEIEIEEWGEACALVGRVLDLLRALGAEVDESPEEDDLGICIYSFFFPKLGRGGFIRGASCVESPGPHRIEIHVEEEDQK